MADDTVPRLPWVPAFLAARAAGLSVRKAAAAAGISASTAHWLRKEDARFARDWDEARRGPHGNRAAGSGRRTPHWRKDFFEALARTSNVTASAAEANVPVATVYKLKREEAEFATKWLAALHEGYDHLEIELLGYLRDPAPGRKLDVAGALRLLAAHRATVERRRAMEDEEDEQAVLESIDRFIDSIQVRREANAAILADRQDGDGPE